MQPNQNPNVPPAPPVDLAGGRPGIPNPVPPQPSTTPALLMTAAIFFGLGFVLAMLIFGTGGDSVSDQDLQAAVDTRLTEIAPTPMPTATPLPSQPMEVLLTDYSPTLGPSDAPVKIVEFSDYLCPYCGRFHEQTFKPLIEHYGNLVQVAYREYPVIGTQLTEKIALSALCINEQGKYWDYIDLLWPNQTSIRSGLLTSDGTAINEDSTVLADYAEVVGADMDAYTTCVADGRYNDEVQADLQTGYSFGINGTPTFYINGKPLIGAQPIEVFMDVIDAELVAQGVTPPDRPSNESTISGAS
ncbi:MAG: DsbA family protein [Chloroflexi bacterium]|nr:DsbA family protein [Chloroflexota bacterium]